MSEAPISTRRFYVTTHTDPHEAIAGSHGIHSTGGFLPRIKVVYKSCALIVQVGAPVSFDGKGFGDSTVAVGHTQGGTDDGWYRRQMIRLKRPRGVQTARNNGVRRKATCCHQETKEQDERRSVAV